MIVRIVPPSTAAAAAPPFSTGCTLQSVQPSIFHFHSKERRRLRCRCPPPSLPPSRPPGKLVRVHAPSKPHCPLLHVTTIYSKYASRTTNCFINLSLPLSVSIPSGDPSQPRPPSHPVSCNVIKAPYLKLLLRSGRQFASGVEWSGV